jgi:hypothetical protein
MVWDDDWILTKEGIRELRGHLSELKYDRLDALSLFFWDRVDTFNGNLLEHWAPALFRVHPGDDFPTHFVVHAPERIARSRSAVRLANPMLNFGWLTKQDRAEAWAASKRAGRIDAFTLNLVDQNPPLIQYTGQTVRELHAPAL